MTAEDADGDAITFSITGSNLIINSQTGLLSFDNAPDYESKPSYSGTVTASDGSFIWNQNIIININNLNDNPPIFTSSQIYEVAENQRSIGRATAIDADGSALVSQHLVKIFRLQAMELYLLSMCQIMRIKIHIQKLSVSRMVFFQMSKILL